MLSFGVTYADVALTGIMESTYTFNGKGKGIGAGLNGGSEFRLGGTEDLGNGLNADFNYAFIQDHNKGGDGIKGSGGPVKNYNSYVGLNGGFGSVRIGQQWTPLDNASWDNDSTGGVYTLSRGDQKQAAGSVTYISPNFAGFTLTAQGLNEKQDYAGFSLKYAAEAFSVAFAYHSENGQKDQKSLGGTYDFGVVKLFANGVMQSGQKDRFGVGLSAPVGDSTTVAVSYSEFGKDKNAAFLAKYSLSKRTAVYFLTKYDDLPPAASKSTNAIGVEHKF